MRMHCTPLGALSTACTVASTPGASGPQADAPSATIAAAAALRMGYGVSTRITKLPWSLK